jgi:hypothetical protein
VASGGVRSLDGVAALVHPGIDAEPVSLTSPFHELPHTDCMSPAHRIIGVPALDEGEIPQVTRKTLRLESAADHGLITGAARQEDLHSGAGDPLEVVQVVLNPRMGGERPYVDIPADLVGAELRNYPGVRLRIGQIVEGRVRRGILPG